MIGNLFRALCHPRFSSGRAFVVDRSWPLGQATGLFLLWFVRVVAFPVPELSHTLSVEQRKTSTRAGDWEEKKERERERELCRPNEPGRKNVGRMSD